MPESLSPAVRLCGLGNDRAGAAAANRSWHSFFNDRNRRNGYFPDKSDM